MQRKINTLGKYTQFEGVTVVCNLQTDIRQFYESLKEALPRDVYSILPLESMHMTLKNIMLLNDVGGDRNVYESKKATLGRINFVNEECVVNVEDAYYHGVHLNTRIEESQKLGCWSMEIANELTSKLSNAINRNAHRLHMTFAYKYNNRKLSFGEIAEIQKAFRLLPRQLKFAGPVLCEFKDMILYTPM